LARMRPCARCKYSASEPAVIRQMRSTEQSHGSWPRIAASAAWWLAATTLIYAWLVYPALVAIGAAVVPASRARGRISSRSIDHPMDTERILPRVSIVVAVHNEEDSVERKLRNCFDLDYPTDRLEVVVASDGSNDRTNDLVASWPGSNLKLLCLPPGTGKSRAQNAAVVAASGDLVVFTDADTMLDRAFARMAAKSFADPTVGAVAGRIVWLDSAGAWDSHSSDLYWRFEHWLWRKESALGVLAWSSGACMAVRRSLFRPMEPHYGEDCVVPLDVTMRGFRVEYQTAAVGFDYNPRDPHAAFNARVRMTLRSFGGTVDRMPGHIAGRRFGVLWATVSHKILRWVTAYLLLVLFVAGTLLGHRAIYRLATATQLLFYGCAIVGYILDLRKAPARPFSAVFAFCSANVAMAVGVAQVVLGRRIVAYRSDPRATAGES
jgi:cellulose synthase/poly-beta-1,6-N-acetylglucosamine synthase-like glycosyltransferase